MAFTTPYITDKFTAYKGETLSAKLSMAVGLIDDYTKKGPIGNIRVTIRDSGIKPVKNPSGYYLFTNLGVGKYIVVVESDFYLLWKKTVDISKVKVMDITLNFNTVGPAAGATSTRLKDVSKLQKGDAIEFRKPGTKEQRSITSITPTTKEIYWVEGLNFDFSTPDSTVIALKNPIVEFVLKPMPTYPFPGYATLIRGQVRWSSGVKHGSPVVGANLKIVDKSIETTTDKNGEFVFYFRGLKKEDLPGLTGISIEIKKDTYSKTIAVTEEGEAITVREGKTIPMGVVAFP